MALRDNTTGPITVKMLHHRVWLWDGEEIKANCWHLVIRQEPNSKNEIKYSLSSAASETPISGLAFMQGRRYFAERAIEDAKSTAHLADYHVRGWIGWRHHTTMMMLAMLFILKIKNDYQKKYQLLSCNDIRELLYHFLPKRAISTREVLDNVDSK